MRLVNGLHGTPMPLFESDSGDLNDNYETRLRNVKLAMKMIDESEATIDKKFMNAESLFFIPSFEFVFFILFQYKQRLLRVTLIQSQSFYMNLHSSFKYKPFHSKVCFHYLLFLLFYYFYD